MKYIILMNILTVLLAQRYGGFEEDHRFNQSERPARVENMVIWRLSEDLNLTTQQAEKFFPRFRDHRKEMEKINVEEKKVYEGILEKSGMDDKVTSSEAKRIIDTISELQRKRIDLQSNFIIKMDGILDPEQLIKFAVFKHRLARDMRSEMQGNKDRGKRKKNRKRMKKWSDRSRF
mgnify:CR=1 FL=1